jgi:hypothetical protein
MVMFNPLDKKSHELYIASGDSTLLERVDALSDNKILKSVKAFENYGVTEVWLDESIPTLYDRFFKDSTNTKDDDLKTIYDLICKRAAIIWANENED